jgi:hypothetical protein
MPLCLPHAAVMTAPVAVLSLGDGQIRHWFRLCRTVGLHATDIDAHWLLDLTGHRVPPMNRPSPDPGLIATPAA